MRQLFRKYPLSRTLSALAVAVAFVLVPLDSASAAYTYKRLHSFCSRINSQGYCSDGSGPWDRLAMDQNGSLYGTAETGGNYNNGVVFKLVPNADKSRYREYVLHNFAYGEYPVAAVILDVDGNVYGTARGGGKYFDGYIFKLTHGSHGWAFGVLKNFCADGGSSCTDGDEPQTGLSYAGQDSGNAWNESSPLFGTTNSGGTYNNGVTYELTHGSSWNYTVIHNFQTSASPNEVLVDSAGNIYGTTYTGGSYGGGLMYKLASGTWSETILHNFCDPTFGCSDANGYWPVGRLAMDASGNLFGTTFTGGSNTASCRSMCGVLFERPSGGTYSVLHKFCSQTNCTDGANPTAGVIIDGSGNLFGTTSKGGAVGAGAVFEFSRGTESVVYSFCIQGCNDGSTPLGAVIRDSAGGLFATTSEGGVYASGTVFRLGP